MDKKVSSKAVGLTLTFIFSLFAFSILLPPPVPSAAVIEERDLKETTPETKPSPSAQTAPATQPSAQKEEPQQEQKGGIYKMGRAFKKAGGGIKKGFLATGRAFKKAGRSIKGAFVGEKTSDDPKPSPSLDHRGDEPETQPVL